MSDLSRRTAAVLLCLCVLLGLGLRSVGLDALLPCGINPDGNLIPEQVEMLREDYVDPDGVSSWQMYPHLIAEIVALFPGHERAGNTLRDHLEAARAPFLEVRRMVALLSLLAIPATYWLARHFLSRAGSVLAALLAATSLLALLFSQQARPHAPAAAFAALSVAAALELARRPTWVSVLLAGLALGLAIGTLQSGVACALPIAAAWWLRDRDEADPAHRWGGPLAGLVLAFGIAWMLYPHRAPSGAGTESASAVLGGLVPFSGTSPQDVRGVTGHNLHLDRFDGGGFATVGSTLLSYEPLVLTLALIGLALGARSLWRCGVGNGRRRDVAITAAYVVPYLVAIGAYEETFERFCLQLLPFAACLAAAAWERVAMRTTPATALALAAAVGAQPLCSAVAMQRARMQSSGAEELAAWIEREISPETQRVLLLPGVDVPLARSAASLGDDATAPWTTRWILYQRKHVDSAWDAVRYDLRHSPLRKTQDCMASLEDPIGAARRGEATHVALIQPPPLRAETPALRLARTFEAALQSQAVLEFSTPEREAEPGATLAMDLNFHPDDPIWALALLTEPVVFGPKFALYRLK